MPPVCRYAQTNKQLTLNLICDSLPIKGDIPNCFSKSSIYTVSEYDEVLNKPYLRGGRNEHTSMDHLRRPCWMDCKHNHGHQRPNGSARQHHRRYHRCSDWRSGYECLRRPRSDWLQPTALVSCYRG